MNKRWIVVLLIVAASQIPALCQADNTVRWATSGTGPVILYDNTGTTPLLGQNAGDGVAYLVQLIYAGANGIADPVHIGYTNQYAIGDALSDDVFAAYSWVGAGTPNFQGRFQAPDYTNPRADGSRYFIRAWESPASSVGTGEITASPTDWYGDSEVFTINGFGPPPALDNFLISANFNTDMQMVPEPGTLALLGLGVVLSALRRRQRT